MSRVLPKNRAAKPINDQTKAGGAVSPVDGRFCFEILTDGGTALEASKAGASEISALTFKRSPGMVIRFSLPGSSMENIYCVFTSGA